MKTSNIEKLIKEIQKTNKQIISKKEIERIVRTTTEVRYPVGSTMEDIIAEIVDFENAIDLGDKVEFKNEKQ